MSDTVYTLPDLACDPGALEPHIRGRIMALHHHKHRVSTAYVTGANTALEELAVIRETDDLSTIAMLEKSFAFHLSGHVLHSVSGPT
jgi:Fe-Mn family superoxide dismutase